MTADPVCSMAVNSLRVNDTTSSKGRLRVSRRESSLSWLDLRRRALFNRKRTRVAGVVQDDEDAIAQVLQRHGVAMCSGH